MLSLICVIESESVFKYVPIDLLCVPDCSASLRISSATTANPFPLSPACADSIAAFMARRFVWLEMLWITFAASRIVSDS